MSDPYCKALLLCEALTCDQFTGRWSIVNVMSGAYARGFPVHMMKLCCYAAVSGCAGLVNAKFRLLDTNLEIVRELTIPPVEATRDQETEFGGVFTDILLPKPGRYSVEFVVDGHTLQSSRLDAVEVPLPA